MDHVRIDPKFRRKPRPKRVGWEARQVFKFLLEVSAEFDLRGRFSKSMQDDAWLADEWANGDVGALVTCAEMIRHALPVLEREGMLHREGAELVITDWDDFYKPSQTNAERQANYRNRTKGPVTPVTTAVTRNADVTPVVTSNGSNKSNATEQHDTTQHNTTQNVRTTPDPVAAVGGTPLPPEAVRELADRRNTGDRLPGHVPRAVSKPETPPEEWLAEDFWRWAQWKRQEAAGLPVERVPDLRRLGDWWSAARMGHAAKALQEAFLRFGDDPFWQGKTPPLPFGGFMSQWDRFVPAKKGAARAS